MQAKKVTGWLTKGDDGDFILNFGSSLKKIRFSSRIDKIRELMERRENEVMIKARITGGNGILNVEDVEIIYTHKSTAKDSVPDPSVPSDFARRSWLVMRLPKYRKVLMIQHAIMRYFREFLDKEGFVELLPPVISPASDPGLRGAAKLITKLYGVPYELTSSTIMFKQVSATALGKIYFMARNVREEPPENIYTGRHLIEFTQLDVEWAGASMEDVMELAEDMIHYVCRKLTNNYGHILKEFRKGRIDCWKPPYERMRYEEALELARRMNAVVREGSELSQEAEEAISLAVGKPFWITNYPANSRGFYYLRDPKNPEYNRDFNLILPEGYGEVVDGGEREYRPEEVLKRIRELRESEDKYSWFLEALKEGIAPSAGFGLGIERFTRYVLGLRYVWEAVPFPKPPGITSTP